MSKREFLLSLSSGGSLGYAHIGVLKAFIETGINIKAISGSSMGGIVGGLFAIGISPYDMEDMFSSIMTDFSVSLAALLGHIRIQFGPAAYLRDKLSHVYVSSSRIPLFIYATDLRSGRPYLFRGDDPLSIALRSTSSIPGVFPPVRYKGMLLVDGGASVPMPTGDLVKMKREDTILVGVDVYTGAFRGGRNPSPMDAYLLLMGRHARCQGKGVDYIISPELKGYTNIMYSRVRDIVERGYMAGIKFLERLCRKGVI